MFRSILVLPDGREVSSGVGTVHAISNVTVTETVNEGQELTLGSCCCSMLEATLITPGGGLSIAAGDEVILYREDSTGQRHKVGVFILEKPTRATANTLKITGYDRISLLDRDMTDWLESLQEWPYSLEDLAHKVCTAVGLTLISSDIPNGAIPVQKISAQGITGRQLMKWIGQAAGSFCRATEEGLVELGWYEPLSGIWSNGGHMNIVSGDLSAADGAINSDTLSFTDDGNGNISVIIPAEVEDLYYYQNGLSSEEYSVAPIEKVWLRQSDQDVGAVYPDIAEESNTYTVTGNLLLAGCSAQELEAVASTLFERLKGVSYTPCKLTIPASPTIKTGSILSFTDMNGKALTVYVMSKRQAGQRDIIECTGSHTRNSTTVVNEQSFQALKEKVLNLQLNVEGLKVENKSLDGKIASLKMDVDGISAEVSRQQGAAQELQKQMSSIKQTADEVSVQVQSIVDNGTTKVVSGLGLTVDGTAVTISRPDSNMTNSLDETGMFVIRDKGTAQEEVMLQADTDGVIATDVKVRNYLIIGSYARFEDYTDGANGKRTACFYLGGS